MQRVHALPDRSGVLLLVAACLFVGAGCGTPHIDKPRAPDMGELIAAYEAPDADFDSSAAEEISLAIVAIDELLARTDLREQLVDVLADIVREASDLSDLQGNGVDFTFEADGYMRVTRICSGWRQPLRPDRDANGALLVTATFSQTGLDPIVWGLAQACRYRVGDVQIELDQPALSADAVSVFWGDAPSERDVSERTLLADLNLQASIDGDRLPLDIDFRSLADGTLEYRIQRPDGSLIAQVGEEDTLTLRAANGTFVCDARLDCSETSGAEAP